MMKKILYLVLAVVFMAGTASASVITSIDFESGAGVGYTTSITELTDMGSDYFTHSDGTNISGVYNSPQGSSFFAAMDTNADAGGASPASLFISGINITGFTSLDVDLSLAEDDDGNNQDWDNATSFEVFATIDGGTAFKIFGVENDDMGFNREPLVDLNLDGIGDGPAITDIFTAYNAPIAGTGATLDLEFRFTVPNGDEDIAVDNIIVNGISAAGIPEPSSLALLALLGLVGVIRRR